MNITARLMLVTALVAVIVGNVLPWVGALIGVASWSDTAETTVTLNVSYVLPAMIATLPAAWIYAHDPDLLKGSPWLVAAGILLLSCCAFFLLMLVWVPMMEGLQRVVGQDAMPLPRFAHGIGETMFLALTVALIAAVPAWLVETAAVRWVQRRATAVGAGMSA